MESLSAMEDLIETKWRVQQEPVCALYGVDRAAVDSGRNSGGSANIVGGRFFEDGVWPLNAQRHVPTSTTTGWFIWAGELVAANDFFKPVHSGHLETWCADLVPYLGLPPGWCVQLAPNHLDVWFEPANLVE